MSGTVDRLKAVKGPFGCRADYADWNADLSAAPHGEVCLGTYRWGEVFPMIRGGLRAKSSTDRAMAGVLLGAENDDEIWWALYPDGEVASFAPNAWRPYVEQKTDVSGAVTSAVAQTPKAGDDASR